MKAKMVDKPAEAGQYLCSKCQTTFKSKGGTIACPKCHNASADELVLIAIF